MKVALGVLGALLCAASHAQQVSVATTTCEHLINPLGIATQAPRLGWTLASGLRNVSQTLYRLRIGSTAAAAPAGDVFDSGVVASASSLIVYSGPALQAGQRYFWTVQVNGTAAGFAAWGSNWSAVASFSIGLLAPTDWSSGSSSSSSDGAQPAAVIGMGSAPVTAAPYVRTSFTLSASDLALISAGSASALLHVASIGYQDVYCNGQPLEPGSVLLPSTAYLGRVIPSHTYDLAPALQAGQNVIGVWLGPGWSMFMSVNPAGDVYNLSSSQPNGGGRPLLAAKVLIQPPASPAGQPAPPPLLSFGSNSSWKVSLSSYSHIGNWQSSNFGGDALNWTAAIPGWSTPAVDDSGWAVATEYPAVLATRVIVPEMVEPTRVLNAVPAASVVPCPSDHLTGQYHSHSSSAGAAGACYLITMAELFTGWLQLDSLVGTPGATITLSYSTNVGAVEEFNQADSVVLPAAGNGSFIGKFSYHEMQYITVQGALSAPPSVASITGLRLMTARERHGAFSCSDPLLNAIYDASVRTYEGLTTGGMSVDCPHRERLGYGGDDTTSMEFAMSTFARPGAFFGKVARDWADVQLGGWPGGGNGSLPHTAPTIDGGGGPAWGAYSVFMPWALWVHTGDPQVLSDAYPTMAAFVSFLLSHVDTANSGLLQPFGGSWGFLGDWLTPHGSEESGTPESILFNNCILVRCLRLTAQVATLLGNSTAAAQYNAQAATIANATHAAFYHANNATYLYGRQTHLALPLLAEVVPPALVSAVQASLSSAVLVAQNGHWDTGLTGTYVLTKYLTDPTVGRDDLLHVMASQTTAPSYGQLLASGYTTWPEDWQGSQSRMHGCFNGIGLWYPQGLLGVRATEAAPGFAMAVVKPAYSLAAIAGSGAGAGAGAPPLSWAAGATTTPYGPLSNAWSANITGPAGQGNYSHVLTIPANAAALLWLPGSDPATVTESGQPALAAPGVSYIRTEQPGPGGAGIGGVLPATVWQLGSGSYDFASWV